MKGGGGEHDKKAELQRRRMLAVFGGYATDTVSLAEGRRGCEGSAHAIVLLLWRISSATVFASLCWTLVTRWMWSHQT